MDEEKENAPDKWNGKRLLKFVAKVLIGGIALFYVYRKTDFQKLSDAVLNIHVGYMVLAFLTYNVSKWVTIFRYQDLLKAIEIRLSLFFNWKLYYIGAFYNLFLPGAVGGDGYKVYILRKLFQKPLKLLISATLLDRICGMVAILFLTAFMWVFTPSNISYKVASGIAICLLVYPLYYGVLKVFFKKFTSHFISTNSYSIISQVFQIVTAWAILKGLGVEAGIWNYLILFMISSVVSVIPVTPGGLGLREFTSTIGYTYLSVDKEPAVLLATLFFLVTAVSSLIGLVFYFTKMEVPRIAQK